MKGKVWRIRGGGYRSRVKGEVWRMWGGGLGVGVG